MPLGCAKDQRQVRFVASRFFCAATEQGFGLRRRRRAEPRFPGLLSRSLRSASAGAGADGSVAPGRRRYMRSRRRCGRAWSPRWSGSRAWRLSFRNTTSARSSSRIETGWRRRSTSSPPPEVLAVGRGHARPRASRASRRLRRHSPGDRPKTIALKWAAAACSRSGIRRSPAWPSISASASKCAGSGRKRKAASRICVVVHHVVGGFVEGDPVDFRAQGMPLTISPSRARVRGPASPRPARVAICRFGCAAARQISSATVHRTPRVRRDATSIEGAGDRAVLSPIIGPARFRTSFLRVLHQVFARRFWATTFSRRSVDRMQPVVEPMPFRPVATECRCACCGPLQARS